MSSTTSSTPKKGQKATRAKSKTSASPAAKTRARKPKSGATTTDPLIHGVEPYKPKKNEPYMNEAQLQHFQTILHNWKLELMEEVDRTIDHLQDDAGNLPDANDRASQEAEFGLELKTRDRERKLIRKINSALERISQGSYGYCDETGEEIGLARLEARPIATLCLEAQERYESAERHFGGRDSGS